MLKNITIRTRLFALIGLMLIFMAGLSVVNLLQINQIEKNYNTVSQNLVPSLYAISKIRGDMNRVAIYEKRHILNTETNSLQEIEQVISDKKAEINQLLKDHETLLVDEEKPVFDAVKNRWAAYLDVHERVLMLSREKKSDDARILSGMEGTARFNEVAQALENWANLNYEIAKQVDAVEIKLTDQAQSYAIIVPILGAILALAAGMMIANTITKPISQLGIVSARISDGELDQRAEEGNSEVGRLGRSFNQMADNLRQRLAAEQQQRLHLQSTVNEYVDYLQVVSRGVLTERVRLNSNGHGAEDPLIVLGQGLNDMTGNLQRMISQVREAAQNLSTATSEILAGTTQQVSGSSEQSAAVSQTTTTVNEVKTIAEQASERAREVSSAAQRTMDVSRSGQRAMEDTIESMNGIKGKVEGIAERILALSEQTRQIGEIISSVNEIASQSNILALNASVEAARAGEHGKGFAVVALEVRTLAEQSRQATGQVRSILSQIQKATDSTVMATEEGTKGVDHGVNLAAQARKSIEQLAQVITESNQVAIQVAAGGQQQLTGIDQIAVAMQNINQATVQSLASTRQMERAAQDLNNLAKELMETVSQYQV